MKFDGYLIFLEALVLSHVGLLSYWVANDKNIVKIIALSISVIACVVVLVCLFMDARVRLKKLKSESECETPDNDETI